MDRALLHASISTSVQVADLSILGQLIFERMFPHADFQGRLPGHPRKVKATVIPMVDASAEEVAEQLEKMHQSELIIWYEAGREKYVQLVSWWRYQDRRFAHPSKYPAPKGWKDRIRYNDPHEPKRLILENWEGVFGEPRNGKRKGDPQPKQPTPDAYVGDLHRPPTKEAQNDPSSSASSSASSSKDQDQRPLAAAREKKPPAPPPAETEEMYFIRVDEFFKTLTNGNLDEWRQAYPVVSLEDELLRAKSWLKGNPVKRKKNLRRFIVSWLARAQEKGGISSGRGTQGRDGEHRTAGVRAKYAGR